jgi:PAS domain S-box-containing protein
MSPNVFARSLHYVERDDTLPLTIRLFRMICAATTVINLLVVLPLNAFQNLPIQVNVAVVVLGLFGLYCLRASWRGRHYLTLYYFVLVGLLNPIWFPNAGSEGSITFYFFPAILYPLAMFRGRKRWALTGLMVFNLAALFIAEYLDPSLTQPFHSPNDRIVDLVTGVFCSCLLLIVVSWLILDNYDREQARLSVLARDLAASEKNYRLLAENGSDVIWLFDLAADHFSYVSPSVEKLRGFTAAEVLGQTMAEALTPESYRLVAANLPERMAAFAAGDEFLRTQRHEVDQPRKDGTVVPTEVVTTLICDERRRSTHIQGVSRDITARKQAEADRLVLSKLESTGIMAGGIAHDFNNLLTVVMLGLEEAQLGQELSAEVRTNLDSASQATQALRSLTQQLIVFSRGGEPVRRLAAIEPIVRESAKLALSGSNVAARFAIAPDLRGADIDEGQIGQVIRNLVLNAREAMAHGGVVTIRAENVRSSAGITPALSPGDYLRVEVSDEGAGIPPEVLPKIFDPYFSTKQRGDQKGMGLGLTICHSVIKRHWGTITVDSTPGRGTSFSVYLPASPKPVPAMNATPPPAVNETRPGRILVMDDELSIRKMLGTVLGRMGYTFALTSHGQEAVDAFAKAKEDGHPFDLVFLDLTVRDGMGGIEAARRLRSIDPAVKMIVMSGYSSDQMLQEYAREGFVDALPKPFDLNSMKAVISRTFGS